MTADRLKRVRRTILLFLWWVTIALFAGYRLIAEAEILLNMKMMRRLIEKKVEESLHVSLTAGKGGISVGGGVGVSFNAVSLRTETGFSLSAEKVNIVLSPIRMIHGDGWIERICLIKPRLTIDLTTPGGEDVSTNADIEIVDPHLTIITKTCSIAAEGGMNAWIRLESQGGLPFSGEADFDNASITFNTSSLTIDGSIRSNGGALTTSGLVLTTGGTKVSIAGTYTFSPRCTFAGSIAISGLRIGGQGDGSGILGAILHDLEGSADFTASNISLLGVPIARASAILSARAGTLSVQNLTAAGPFLSGSGGIVIHPPFPTWFDVTFSLKNYPIDSLIAQAASSTRWIEGTMQLEGRVWGNTASLNGDLNFASFDGRIMKYEFLSKLFGVMNLYRLLTGGLSDLKERGFPYRSMASEIKIRDGLVSFDQFLLESNRMKISAYGTFSMKSGLLDVYLGIQPLETVDKIISIIPVIGWLMSKKEGGFFITYLKISGKPENPTVMPVPFKGLAKNISGLLMRTITLPHTIITKPGRLVPGIKEK